MSNDAPETFDDSPEGKEAAQPIGYNKSGREISRTDVSRVLALKSVEKLSGEEQIQAVASMLLPPNAAHQRSYYRKQELRGALGADRAVDTSGAALRQKILSQEQQLADAKLPPRVQWAQAARVCREADGKVELAMVRLGDSARQSAVDYRTYSGTATEGVDYEAAYGTIVFAPGETMKSIVVKIINDDEEEDDEHFAVRLFNPRNCSLGEVTECDVTIQDDDGPGELHFEAREIEVYESSEYATVTIMRTHGCEGTISCHWATRDGTAMSGHAYEGADGKLEFGDGITSKTLQVKLIDTGAYHRADEFQIVLFSAAGGSSYKSKKPARFVTDGATRTRRASIFATVHVHSDSGRRQRVDEMVQLLDFSQQAASEPAADTWGDQFDEAVALPTDGSSISLVMWLLALPWKLIGACVPPPAMGGGWACFGVALVFIGVLTGLIGDLAGHMGCCMGLQPSVTAITFVALGTSLPDTFASRAAAVSEPHADASIVNITGSNSVNVFLGLGMPWAAAAIFWALNGKSEEQAWRQTYKLEDWYTNSFPVGFAVPAGDLAYSVTVFCVCSVICLVTLCLRRLFIGYELGGPSVLKWMTSIFFIFLWLVYILLSILKSTS